MMRSWVGRIAGPGILCLIGTGCVTPGTWLTDSMPGFSPGQQAPGAVAVKPGAELPADQALHLCTMVARQMDQAGNDEGALEQWQKVAKLDPANQQAARRLAVLYDRSCQFSKAEAEYRKLAQANPRDAEIACDWGYSHYLRNNWNEAEAKTRQALELNPKHARAHSNLGLVLGQKGQFPEALREFQSAGLSEAEAHSNLAFVYWTKGQLEEARRECQTAVRLDGGCTRAKQMLAALDQPPRPLVQARGGPARADARAHGSQGPSPRAAQVSDDVWENERAAAVRKVAELYGPGAQPAPSGRGTGGRPDPLSPALPLGPGTIHAGE